MSTKTQSVTIIYEGKALDKHKMNIMAFAESLKGLGEAIYVADSLINGEGGIEVNIDADLIAGSFGFEIEVKQTLKNAKDILQLLGLSAGKALLGSDNVIEILRRLNGRKIDIVETGGPDGDVKLWVDGEQISCSADVEKIVNSPEIRKAVDSFIRQPLLWQGIESFGVKRERDDKHKIIEVKKDEADEFKSPKVLFETREEEDEFETSVTFLSAHTDKKSGWRVEFLGEKRMVRMEDDEFMILLKRENAPHIFGTLFAVKMKKITRDSGGDIKESYAIIKVGRQFGGK
ncbi:MULTISPECIES: hypothetical protein [Pectobacterium]|uniref:hypothetical protein n=1 Tax=Pectobacterium TaxID=122277 RepID=UPI001CF5DAD1|nr:hypothetical protein [Pectobacterium odoriferum]MCA6962278.1 hypothetical protein [Pectobacterium odoriferum]MCH5010377.1 hypothetical protein [Pectobacterium odoriferum]